MPTSERAIDAGTRRAERHIGSVGDEFLDRRRLLGLSQQHVASSSHLSRGRYRLIERGRAANLTILELDRVSAVLGLDSSIKLFPGGPPVRDAAQALRIRRFIEHVRAPLRTRIEVALPTVSGRTEMRAWDLVIDGRRERTAAEFEMRLTDVQAQWRRLSLKRRDDPVEHFLLVVADTRSNRRVLAEFEMLFDDLPRLRPSAVWAELEAGRHPPSGIVLF